jgi:hypothetical protein
MTDDIFDDFDDEELVESKPFDINEMKQNLPSYTNEKLCEMIVCDRYLGGFRDIAVVCMEELSKRRVEGSDFAFEAYIDNSLKAMPKLDFTVPDIRDVLRQFVGKGIK